MTPVISILVVGVLTAGMILIAAGWAMLWPVRRDDDGGYLP